MLTSLAILLPSPPTLCTRVVPAGLQSPTFLQPEKLMTLSYLKLGLKLWLVSHLSYFLFCLFPGFCGGGDAVSSMWFCMLQSGLSSPSKILMINQKTWRRKSLRRKLENVLVKVSWGSDRDFHIMSHISHERSGKLFTEVFVGRTTWTGVVILSKEI